MFDVENEKPISVDGKSKMKPVESYDIKILSIGFSQHHLKLLSGEDQWLQKL
jgi:hypothetical protein